MQKEVHRGLSSISDFCSTTFFFFWATEMCSPTASSPDRGVPGYSGSTQGRCSARAYNPSNLETSSAASPQTKTAWDLPLSHTWEGREDGRRWVGEWQSRSATNFLGALVEWLNEGRAEGHSPARMDGEVLAHISHQLWGPMSPDALGGPGLSCPGQPLIPDLGTKRSWRCPGKIPTIIPKVYGGSCLPSAIAPLQGPQQVHKEQDPHWVSGSSPDALVPLLDFKPGARCSEWGPRPPVQVFMAVPRGD